MTAELTAILLVIGFFMLGVVSPGPNLLVVAERSMGSGFRAGFVTGLGVATGDGLYAGAGLLGLATVVEQAGWLFGVVKILGGLYLAWMGWRMVRRKQPVISGARVTPESTDLGRCFREGLLTDLANPKTIVFFASIFAMVYDPALPAWVAGAMWLGIVVSSVVWRAVVALGFSRGSVRAFYGRFRRGIEVVFGAILIALGVRLAVPASSR